MAEVTEVEVTQVKEAVSHPIKSDASCSQDQQNALKRMVSLPLMLSTIEGLQGYYSNIKNTYPFVAPYLEACEGLTNAAANLAVASSKPVVVKYGDTLNSYVNSGLDKLEVRMPILHQPAHEVLGNAKDKATSLLNDKVDKALCYTENMVNYYLPGDEHSNSDEQLDECEDKQETANESSPEVKDRINGISMKLRRRSYQQAMRRWNAMSTKSRETLSGLNYTVNLIRYAQESLNATTSSIFTSVSSVQESVQKQYTTARQGISNAATVFSKEWEEKVLRNAQHFSKQLVEVCSSYLSYLQITPVYKNLVTKATTAKEMSIDVCKTFTGKQNISQLSALVVAATLDKLETLTEVMLDVVETLSEYPPLNWLNLSPSLYKTPTGSESSPAGQQCLNYAEVDHEKQV